MLLTFGLFSGNFFFGGGATQPWDFCPPCCCFVFHGDEVGSLCKSAMLILAYQKSIWVCCRKPFAQWMTELMRMRQGDHLTLNVYEGLLRVFAGDLGDLYQNGCKYYFCSIHVWGVWPIREGNQGEHATCVWLKILRPHPALACFIFELTLHSWLHGGPVSLLASRLFCKVFGGCWCKVERSEQVKPTKVE